MNSFVVPNYYAFTLKNDNKAELSHLSIFQAC